MEIKKSIDSDPIDLLEAALTPSDRKKVRTLRISIFGFSRGAAQARAFANRLQKLAPNHLGGMPYQIDFLGIFDTVASVGLANLTPGSDGHMAWAHPDALKIPSSVRRCAHLVAAPRMKYGVAFHSMLSATQAIGAWRLSIPAYIRMLVAAN